MSNDILIATLHWVPNFGANIQAYATSQALRKVGCSPVFLNFRPSDLESKFDSEVSAAQRKEHELFVDTHLQQTELVRNQAAFEDLVARLKPKALVSGSDAVLRLQAGSTRDDLIFPNPFWLGSGSTNAEFKQIPKAFLAPSAMGCDYSKLPSETKLQMHKAIDSFAIVNVRDDWTHDQLKTLGFNREIPIVPDPVFLLRDEIMAANDCEQSSVSESPYLIISSGKRLSTSWIQSFTKIANAHDLQVVTLPTPEGYHTGGGNIDLELPINPLDWLKVISGARAYLGIRFHPVAIATIAGIPTLALDLYHKTPLDKSRSKTYCLLKSFGMEANCIGSWLHRLLSPIRAFRMLERQKDDSAKKREKAKKMAQVSSDLIEGISKLSRRENND